MSNNNSYWCWKKGKQVVDLSKVSTTKSAREMSAHSHRWSKNSSRRILDKQNWVRILRDTNGDVLFGACGGSTIVCRCTGGAGGARCHGRRTGPGLALDRPAIGRRGSSQAGLRWCPKLLALCHANQYPWYRIKEREIGTIKVNRAANGASHGLGALGRLERSAFTDRFNKDINKAGTGLAENVTTRDYDRRRDKLHIANQLTRVTYGSLFVRSGNSDYHFGLFITTTVP
jgi:hypothetical protein